MKKYLKPEVKEAKGYMDDIMQGIGIHYSAGNGSQLSNEVDFDDLDAEGNNNNKRFRSVWDEE